MRICNELAAITGSANVLTNCDNVPTLIFSR